MRNINYIRKEDIKQIVFEPTSMLDWKLYPPEPAIKGLFGNVIKKAKPATYRPNKDESGYSEDYFKDNVYYFIKHGHVFRRAVVIVYFVNKTSIIKRFEDDSEAMRYAEFIAKESGIGFIKI